MMLNLVRDKNFDRLSSNTLGEHEKSQQMDISYYELKELQKMVGRQMADQ
jgi:hypothetical protein